MWDRRATLWVGYAAAASPAAGALLSDLDAVAAPWSLLAAPLLLLAAMLDAGSRAPAPQVALGWMLVACGGSAAVLGLGTDTLVLAWGGTVIAGLGVAALTGVPPPTSAVLALWTIPIPTAAYLLASPALERVWAGLGAAAASLAGIAAVAEGTAVRSAGGALYVSPHQGGLHTAAMLALVGWYAAVRRDTGPVRAVGYALACAVGAPLVQAAGVVVGAWLLALGAGPANAWLRNGVWLAVVAVGVAVVERQRLRPGAGPRAARPARA